MKLFRFSLFFILFVAQTHIAQAQSTSKQNLMVEGLAVTPFIIETQLEAGKIDKHTIELENTTDSPLPIDISVNDFVPNEAGDGPSFLPPDKESNPKYSLSNWITIIKQPKFTIPPHERTEVEFVITSPDQAEPGTHYGGILFSYRQTPKNSNIQVTQKAGVLVLASLGHGDERGNITRLLAEPTADYSSVSFLLSFYNQGNVHLRPKGEIYIENILGKQVGQIPVNRDANVVLPESDRLFSSEWKTGWNLGRYTATAVLFYGNSGLEVREVTHFWIIPWQRILLVMLIVALLSALLVFAIKRYNRRLTRHLIKK